VAAALTGDESSARQRSELPLALGSVKFGRNRGVKYPEPFELPDDAALDALLEAAWDGGVRVYDTAPAYGDAETRLRPFVQRHRATIRICSKAGEEYDGLHSRFDFRGAAIRQSCERSLRRLGCERLDLLLLHSDGADRQHLEQGDTLATLLALRAEGKVRAVGISAKTTEGIEFATPLLDAIMAPYSQTELRHGEALARAHAAGKTVLAIKTLASGHSASGDDAQQRAEAALNHVFAQPFVDFAVLGTLRIEHLRQALTIARRYCA
jgi:aryl-alcohol dehydrogenase-like predicted oxidoreductase